MDKSILDNIQLIFVIESMHLRNNGITESVMRKAKFIEEQWGHKSIILTATHNVHLGVLDGYFDHEEREENKTKLSKDTRLFGVFDYFLNSYPYNHNLEFIRHKKCAIEGLEYKEGINGVFDVYDGDKLIRTEFFTALDDNLALVITYDENGKKDKSLVYDHLGHMSKVVVWDKENERHHPYEYYYTIDKKLRIIAEYEYLEDHTKSKYVNGLIANGPINELVKYTFIGDDGKPFGTVKRHEELIGLCIDAITQDPNKKYIIFDENAAFSGAAVVYPKPNVANIGVMHSVHLSDSYNLRSAPQPFYKYMCENRKKFDAIITLTREQAKDFTTMYGQGTKMYPIAHPYPFPIERRDFDERDHKKAIIVARLDPIKNIDIAIDIFVRVIREVPDAKLDIYGFGKEFGTFDKKIEELGVGANIRLRGATEEAAEVMSKAACFLFTSSFEGLGLTLLESISNGCPVISYDIKYGPSYAIKNNVTGFLIKNKDKKAFARQLVKFFNDVDMQRRMSNNCYDDAPRFGVDAYLRKYWDLTEDMYKMLEKRAE